MFSITMFPKVGQKAPVFFSCDQATFFHACLCPLVAKWEFDYFYYRLSCLSGGFLQLFQRYHVPSLIVVVFKCSISLGTHMLKCKRVINLKYCITA